MYKRKRQKIEKGSQSNGWGPLTCVLHSNFSFLWQIASEGEVSNTSLQFSDKGSAIQWKKKIIMTNSAERENVKKAVS